MIHRSHEPFHLNKLYTVRFLTFFTNIFLPKTYFTFIKNVSIPNTGHTEQKVLLDNFSDFISSWDIIDKGRELA